MLEYLTWIKASIVLVSNSFFAAAPPAQVQFQVPQCLVANMPQTILAENEQFRIIDIPGKDVKTLTALAEQSNCGEIINVSNKLSASAPQRSAQEILQKSAVISVKVNQDVYEIKHSNEVNEILKSVVADNIWQTLNHLSAYANRSATKDTGLAAANWLKEIVDALITASGRTDTSTFFVKAGWYKQPSLVTVIGKDIKAPAIVIGAKMDTLDGAMPGADEGSGAASIMETARVLLANKTPFKRPIYIIWYAAGDRNLAGSQYVVRYFNEHEIPVKAVLQLDKTGYRINGQNSTMWVFADNTHQVLSAYLAKLITTYIKVPVDYSRCDSKCSDHASWNDEGIATAFASETKFKDFNPNIGSASDTMNLLNLEHMTNFSKLAVAFVVELASE